MITVVQPIDPVTGKDYTQDPEALLALCIWREARGETLAAKRGVAWTIRNRCTIAPAQGFKSNVSGNILHPGAFSSFNEGDPNSIKFPLDDDVSWQACQLAAQTSGFIDPIYGAVFYFSSPLIVPPVREWGPVTHTTDIGHLHFYKIA